MVMKHRVLSLLTIYSLPILSYCDVASSDLTSNKVLRVGVLAYRGNDVTLKRWLPTTIYLSQKIPFTFKVVPVTNDDIDLNIKNGLVDFVLTNPASYASLESKYGIRRLATLKNALNGGSYTMFGAVIFTRFDRTDIHGLQDLRDKTFMAVHKNAFGGWWMARREIVASGLRPTKDFSELKFARFPQDQIVYAVRDRLVDAGTVRTSVLERMTEAGHIRMDEFKILNPQKSFNFSQQHSTSLYPEWPFAATRNVSQQLAKQVTLALINMPGDSAPAKAARIKGWTLPLDYQPVHEQMKDLHVGPYDQLGQISLENIISKYGYWFVSITTLFLVMIIFSSYVFGLNRRYVHTNKSLEREINVRKELEEQLKHQALHDALTGLPNRILLLDRLRQAIFLCERENASFAIAVIDLDNFKLVNDKLGHEFGDKVLKQVAERFKDIVRKTDTITRFGGDEFILLVDSSTDIAIVSTLTEKFLSALKDPMYVGGTEFRITASIGIAIYPEHGYLVDTLIRHADLAMYQAKLTGNCVITYNRTFTDPDVGKVPVMDES